MSMKNKLDYVSNSIFHFTSFFTNLLTCYFLKAELIIKLILSRLIGTQGDNLVISKQKCCHRNSSFRDEKDYLSRLPPQQ